MFMFTRTKRVKLGREGILLLRSFVAQGRVFHVHFPRSTRGDIYVTKYQVYCFTFCQMTSHAWSGLPSVKESLCLTLRVDALSRVRSNVACMSLPGTRFVKWTITTLARRVPVEYILQKVHIATSSRTITLVHIPFIPTTHLHTWDHVLIHPP